MYIFFLHNINYVIHPISRKTSVTKKKYQYDTPPRPPLKREGWWLGGWLGGSLEFADQFLKMHKARKVHVQEREREF